MPNTLCLHMIQIIMPKLKQTNIYHMYIKFVLTKLPHLVSLIMNLNSNSFEPVTFDVWKNAIVKELKGSPYESLFHTYFPGLTEPPFHNWETERPEKPLFNERSWFASEWTCSRELALQALNRGANALVLEPLSSEHLDKWLDGIHLPYLHTTLVCADSPQDFAEAWIKYTDGLNLKALELSTALDFDPIRAYTSAKMSILAAKAYFNGLSHLPKAFTFQRSIDVRHFADRGAGPHWQLGLILSALNLHFQAENKSSTLNIRIAISVGRDYLLETAKLRALRAVIPFLKTFYPQLPAIRLHLYAQGGTRYFSAQDPHTNLLRLTTQGMAAILGGADEIYLPNHQIYNQKENENHLPLNILHLLRYEARLDHSGDVWAGSYSMEALTEKLAHQAWEVFKLIEDKGGIWKAWESNWLNDVLSEQDQNERNAYNEGKLPILGVDLYPYTLNGLNLPEQPQNHDMHRIAISTEFKSKMD